MSSVTFEVLSNGEIKGPLSFPAIQQGVFAGQYRVEDLYRRTGSTEWKAIGKTLNMNRMLGAIVFGVNAILFCLLGLWLAWYGLRFIRLEHESSSWPWVEGRITSTQIENYHGDRSGYIPELVYIYQIGPKKYFGDTIYPECKMGGTLGWAQSVIARHPTQSTCRVYCSPRNPRFTMLEPGIGPHSFKFMSLGLMVVYTGILVGCLALSIWRKPIDEKPSRATFIRAWVFTFTVIAGFLLFHWLL